MARRWQGGHRGAATRLAPGRGPGGVRRVGAWSVGADKDLPRGGTVVEALSGRSALVIGASSGIGLETANLFADAGAKVHAAARRSEAIRDGAGERSVTAHALDISDKDAVWRVVEEAGE